MLIIRLTRRGRRNDPSFRLVVTESSNPVKGKFLEELGFYNPKLKTKSFKQERISYWLSKGAKCSPTVNNLLVSADVIQGSKVKAWRPKKRQGGAEAAKVETKAEKPMEIETSEVKEGKEPAAELSETADNKESAAKPAPEVPEEKEEPAEEKSESAEPEKEQEAPVEEKKEEAAEETKTE
jgi:small subunit ribosomal protein S16